ncbi:PilZ domain-containing protein [Halobacillus litoralis]|uniref:PilZ domain-containing protein n=1 Tax=Halobacillus litoralis TaxID=45668 RepID=UPI001CD1B096|nr:PilZ domain-containing protein [Halobacillus litoralis]MCA1020548.1 PilZ domain-containing protein [Halobacillus litoralis]
MVYIVWAEALIIVLFTVLLMKVLLKKKAADAPTAADPPAGSVPPSKQPYVKRSLRVDVPHIESKIIIIDIDTKRFKALNQKYFTGYIENISLTGLKFSSAYNIPIQENITISLHFSLDDEDFTLQARMARKHEELSSSDVVYGVEFIEISEKNRERLARILYQLQIVKNKQAL